MNKLAKRLSPKVRIPNLLIPDSVARRVDLPGAPERRRRRGEADGNVAFEANAGNGASYRLLYSKSIAITGTNISLAGYRYSQRFLHTLPMRLTAVMAAEMIVAASVCN